MTAVAQHIVGHRRIPCAPQIIHSGVPIGITTGARYTAFPVAARASSGAVLVAYSDFENHYGGGLGARLVVGNAAGTSYGSPIVLASNTSTESWGPAGIAVRGTRIAVLHDKRVSGQPRTGWMQVTTSTSSWPTPTQIHWQQAGAVPCHLAWVENGTPNGLLLATAYYGLSGVYVAASSDNGATWAHWSKPAPGNAGWSESTITQLADGRLLMVQRKDGGVDRDTLHVRHSADHGVTWSAATPVIRRASGMPTTTLLPDGRLVMVIRDLARRAYESVSLAWSGDGGHTWQVTPVSDEWMMYGQVVVRSDGTPLLVGANQSRTSSTSATVWARVVSELLPTTPGMPTPGVRHLGDGEYSLPVAVTHLGDGTYSAAGVDFAHLGGGKWLPTWRREAPY